MSDQKDDALKLTNSIVLAYAESGGADAQLIPWLFENLYETIKGKLAAKEKEEPRN